MLLNFPAGLTEFTGPDGVKHKPDANGQVEVAAGDLGPFLAQGFMPSDMASAEVEQEADLAALQEAVTGTASGTNTGDETAARIGALINGATAKTAPVDADMLGLMDSASTPANVLKRLSWAYVKSVLKTYFDGLYQTSADAALRAKALSGDLVFVVTPATKSTAHGEAANRTVAIALKTAAGEVHTWFNAALAAGVAVAKSSEAGTVSIPSTTLTFVAGVASVEITEGGAWAEADTNTLTIAAATILGYAVAQKTSVETMT